MSPTTYTDQNTGERFVPVSRMGEATHVVWRQSVIPLDIFRLLDIRDCIVPVRPV